MRDERCLAAPRREALAPGIHAGKRGMGQEILSRSHAPRGNVTVRGLVQGRKESESRRAARFLMRSCPAASDADEAVAAIDVNRLAGHAAGKIAQQIEARGAEVLLVDVAAEG